MRHSLTLATAFLAASTLSMEALARQSQEDLNPPKPKRPTKADKKAAKRARMAERNAGVRGPDGGEQQ